MKKGSGIYFPGLNGLRAIAALSVLIGHTFQIDFGNWGIPQINLPLFSEGVTMFFVISGFLITYLLLVEKNDYQTVNVGKFYLRRILRIWPIYYAYILISIVVLLLCHRQQEIFVGNLWYYIFFAANIPFLWNGGLPLIVHLWSIGVEEQFYLFWPWIVKHTKIILLSSIIIFFIWASLKYGSWFILGNKSLVYRFFSVTRFQCMMVGAIGAVLYHKNNRHFVNIFANKFTQVVLWMVLILYGVLKAFLPAIFVSGIVSILSLGLIIGQITSKGIIRLENPFFDFVGKISYGIYVIHPLLIFLLSKLWLSANIGWPSWIQYVCIYLGVTGCTIALAYFSYTYFEKKILRFKSKFTVVKSHNSRTDFRIGQ